MDCSRREDDFIPEDLRATRSSDRRDTDRACARKEHAIDEYVSSYGQVRPGTGSFQVAVVGADPYFVAGVVRKHADTRRSRLVAVRHPWVAKRHEAFAKCEIERRPLLGSRAADGDR